MAPQYLALSLALLGLVLGDGVLLLYLSAGPVSTPTTQARLRPFRAP